MLSASRTQLLVTRTARSLHFFSFSNSSNRRSCESLLIEIFCKIQVTLSLKHLAQCVKEHLLSSLDTSTSAQPVMVKGGFAVSFYVLLLNAT